MWDKDMSTLHAEDASNAENSFREMQVTLGDNMAKYAP